MSAPQHSAPQPVKQPDSSPAKSGLPHTRGDQPGSFLYAVLGFFIPLVGLILWLSWRTSQPGKASKAGWGALVGFVVSILAAVVQFFLI